jgi:hypothetical protein
MQEHAGSSPLAIDERIKLQRRTAALLAPAPSSSPLGARLNRLRQAHAEDEEEDGSGVRQTATTTVSRVVAGRRASVVAAGAAGASVAAAATPRGGGGGGSASGGGGAAVAASTNDAADRILREAGGERGAPGQGSALLFLQNAGCDAVRDALLLLLLLLLQSICMRAI